MTHDLATLAIRQPHTPTPDVISQLAEIHADAFPADNPDTFTRMVEAGRWDIWVAEQGNQVAGYAAVRDGRLAYMGVRAGRRGRGVGTRLLGALMEDGQHPDGLLADIDTPDSEEGQRRLRFYLRNGAAVVERRHDGWLLWLPPRAG